MQWKELGEHPNISHLSGSSKSLFQLQPVLYLAKYMFVFDTAGLAFFEGIALEKKKKRRTVRVSKDKELIIHCRDKPG